jgi:hypothetical protein
MASSTEEQKLPYMQETKNPKEHVGDEQQYGLSTRDSDLNSSARLVAD